MALAVAVLILGPEAVRGATNVVFHTGTVPIPAILMPSSPSPVIYFRNLLAMSPQQRDAILAKKPPEVRARILAKVSEYAALDPGQRELRLQATELRWYLMPLLRAAPDDRDAQLARVPNDIRDLVQSRLRQWEILLPPLQQEFLENEHIIGYFSGIDSTNNTAGEAAPSDAEQSHWNALSDEQRQAMTSQFNQFFELSPSEKQKALGGLSAAERAQMQKTMEAFDKLPPMQRMQCVRAFGKFTSLSPQERMEFMKNARRWEQMTPTERKAWADLVDHVPQWAPPAPTMIMPPALPVPPNIHTATNHG